jgi:hypothetical protein
VKEPSIEAKLVSFVIETREGKFAEIPAYTLEHMRIEDSIEPIFDEEAYTYGSSYCDKSTSS